MKVNDFFFALYDERHYVIRVRRPCVQDGQLAQIEARMQIQIVQY